MRGRGSERRYATTTSVCGTDSPEPPSRLIVFCRLATIVLSEPSHLYGSVFAIRPATIGVCTAFAPIFHVSPSARPSGWHDAHASGPSILIERVVEWHSTIPDCCTLDSDDATISGPSPSVGSSISAAYSSRSSRRVNAHHTSTAPSPATASPSGPQRELPRRMKSDAV